MANNAFSIGVATNPFDQQDVRNNEMTSTPSTVGLSALPQAQPTPLAVNSVNQNVVRSAVTPQVTAQSVATPSLDTNLQSRVQATNGALNSNPNFVNAVVKAYTGKDATQEQLDNFTGKSVNMVRSAFAPVQQPNTTVDVTRDTPDLQTTSTGETPTPTAISDTDAYINQQMAIYDKISAQSPEQKGLEDTQTGLETYYTELLTKQATQGTRTLELEEQQKIQAKAQKLTDIDNEILGKIAVYNQAKTQIATSPITAGSIRAEQASIQRLQAADISVLDAQRSMLQGQYDNAQIAVDRAIELEFGDIQQNIQNAKDFITINQNKMTSAEKKQSEKSAFVLDAMQDVLDEQKTDKTGNLDIIMNIAKAGGNTSVVDLSKSPEENLQKSSVVEALATSTAGDFQFITGTDNQQGGVFDKNTGTFSAYTGTTSPNATGVVTDGSGTSYDITSYATDPTHESSVQTILDNIGTMDSVEEMDNYIQGVAQGSPVTGQMIANASQEYGTSWETMMAIMQQDSSFGTAGKAPRTFNPGNVGNTDSGAEVNWGDWQSGVNAVANNLSGREVSGKAVDTEIQDAVNLVNNGTYTAIQAEDRLPANKRAEFRNQLNSQPQQQDPNIDILKTKVAKIDSIINHTGLKAAVGPNPLVRNVYDYDEFFNSNTGNFIASVEQLISKETIDTLVALKQRGGTLGALSDQERMMLRDSASLISKWEVKNLFGLGSKVVGYKTKEEDFKNELRTIQKLATTALLKAGGNLLNTEEMSEIESMTGDNSTTFNPSNFF